MIIIAAACEIWHCRNKPGSGEMVERVLLRWSRAIGGGKCNVKKVKDTVVVKFKGSCKSNISLAFVTFYDS